MLRDVFARLPIVFAVALAATLSFGDAPPIDQVLLDGIIEPHPASDLTKHEHPGVLAESRLGRRTSIERLNFGRNKIRTLVLFTHPALVEDGLRNREYSFFLHDPQAGWVDRFSRRILPVHRRQS